MAGPGSYAHAVVGEAESFDRAAHTVTILENDLAPMAIVAFEIGLTCSDKIAPKARPAKYSPLLPKQARSGEQLSRLSGISMQFSSGIRRSCGCKCVNQGQQHWQV